MHIFRKILTNAVPVLLSAILFGIPGYAQTSSGQKSEIVRLMPLVEDRTSMWWRDGFPGITENAARRRMVETGNYWFLFDTEAVKIPRLGSIKTPLGEISGADLKLRISVDGKDYYAKKAANWERFAGPRLIESGQFLQRADVTGVFFAANDGTPLNTEARFEAVAWPDQLGLTLDVRPGAKPFEAGEKSGGRVGGGFGLTGNNRFDIPPGECSARSAFTLSFWVFASTDFKAGRHSPWLVCQNGNEQVDGNFGIKLGQDGVPSLVLNTGGGIKNMHFVNSTQRVGLRLNHWNHVALSYDNKNLRLVLNGRSLIDSEIGKVRNALPGGMTFGARQDGLKGFPFRGVIDEVYLFDRALNLKEVRQLYGGPARNHQNLKPLKKWGFDSKVAELKGLPRETWKEASLGISVSKDKKELLKSTETLRTDAWSDGNWNSVALMMDPLTLNKTAPASVTVRAIDKQSKSPQQVAFDPAIGCHRFSLDGVEPTLPEGRLHAPNDQIERVKIEISNPTESPEVVRLMFEKTARGFRGGPGKSITGVTAMLRDLDGNPTGIPIQLSKNWHEHAKGGTHSGLWFHGITQLRLPPKQSTELEFTLVYSHWGGVAAASHAQLSLIGYGGNHLWEQSALGAWGESICYNPEQVFGDCVVTDVRPLMVKQSAAKKWDWTGNVGGADFFRLFDSKGDRAIHTGVKATYDKTGPCLTDVQYVGGIGKTGIRHQIRSSISRTDDIVRATYRLNMNVTKLTEFSRFVIFQAGSDKYAYTEDQKMAVGTAEGAIREWLTKRGGNVYRDKATELAPLHSWASLHATIGDSQKGKGGLATRGVIIRSWNAKLGGKPAKPWVREHGAELGKRMVSTIDIVPPPSVTRLEPGDFIQATIEFVVVPQYANEYYGPNESLRSALEKHQNRWEMVHREASEGRITVQTRNGKLLGIYPGVTIALENGKAEFEMKGGLGYVPITFGNLVSHRGYQLLVNGKPLDQAVHGKDFWQTNYDSKTKRWSQTFNIKSNGANGQSVTFERTN